MRISFWSVGKENESFIRTGVDDFTKRIGRYYPASWTIIPPPKNAASLSEKELKKREADLILQALRPDDYLIALDERGPQLSSEELANFIQTRANESTKNLVFLIGGAFGMDPEILRTAKMKWSLSRLTFPHQLVRLILAEQIYRACTILQNEKYHHR